MALEDISGVLLLDKSDGMTSNGALQKVKHLFNAKKAGHTGSLDPIATGMLPICFGEATKFAQFFINDDKSYSVSAILGAQMDSGDRTGQVVKQSAVPELSEADIKAAFDAFKGPIKQIPPMFSAVKVDGKRLYKLARKGIEIERKSREVTIHSLWFESYDPATHLLTFKVFCSKGTYVRTLVEDLALKLGTHGFVQTLHRNFVGQFKQEAMVSLNTLTELSRQDDNAHKSHLLPVSSALPPWPKVALNDANVLYFKQGQIVKVSNLPEQGWVQIIDQTGVFIGLGEVQDNQQIKPKRLMKTGH